jgi:16S rRNA (cytosine967-C5)-methyltransferase
MLPAARLQAAIEILQSLENTAKPADLLLREAFRARRYAGAKDRAAIAERVFAVQRRRSLCAWRMGGEDARLLILGLLVTEGVTGETIAALFSGSAYGPAPLSEAEKHTLATPPAGAPPAWVAGEYPQFLEAELKAAFGPALPLAMAAMAGRAPIDIRVNTLKMPRERVAAALAAEGFPVFSTPYSPWGLRLPPGEGSARLGATAIFRGGAFEFQDEAAQITTVLCGAKPGMRVLDLAAGTGGKTLALAAAMKNKGELCAADIAPARLEQLKVRAERTGAQVTVCRKPPKGPFDLVLVDAPCSGTGTWRRQPELRWRITPERLKDLTGIQDALLDQAADLVGPKGRLVYATCSVLPCENGERVEGFLKRHEDFTVTIAASLWPGEPPPGMTRFFKGAPHTAGTDGFFAAVLQKR